MRDFVKNIFETLAFCFGFVIGLVLIVIIYAYSLLSYSFVFMNLCNWFVIDYIPNIDVLEFIPAIGIYMFINFIFGPLYLDTINILLNGEENKENIGKIFKLFASKTIYPWITLLFAFIFKTIFM